MFGLLPITVPALVIEVGFHSLLNPHGIDQPLLSHDRLSNAALHPVVRISVTTTLGGIHRNAAWAAASLATAPKTALRRITLPLALPGTVTDAIFAFATSPMRW